MMRKEYGKLMQRFLTFWNLYKEKAIRNIAGLRESEKDYDVQLNFEKHSKFESIISILLKEETQFKKS